MSPVRLAVWLGVGYGALSSFLAIVRGISLGDGPDRWISAAVTIVLLLALLAPEPARTPVVFGAGTTLQLLDIVNPQDGAGSRLPAVVALALVAVFLAYVNRRLLLALWAAIGIGCGIVVEFHIAPSFRGSTLELVLPTLIVMSAVGWAAGYVTRSRRAAEAELARLSDRRRRERIALARELHDSVARDLTIIAMQSAVLRTTDRPAEQEFARAAIEDTARSGLDALKRLLVVLRAEDAVEAPSLVRDLEAESLENALADSARHLAMLGYQVTVGTAPTGLSRTAETTAVRVVREGTTNITKHATPGVLCRLECRTEGDQLVVRIDNQSARGTAPQVPSTGLGIESLAERLRLLGGSITGERVDGTWVLEAHIPLTAPLADSVPA
ncbi:sensor histidine kinase [Mobilicoccus caccae]|uniref:histidine kinase n=1 Tax=Mobilicoccus caccae TaxID=1859295 RepID=A0ABQ6IR59_9MICO|nr:histidine kinase [Mobilicoccus caccae]GMA39571.1 hypothetical protein GCM10025883_16160 [Mobilicoccus caccae]